MNSAEVLIKFKGDTKDVEDAIEKEKSDFKSLQKTGELAIAGITAAVDAMVGSLVKQGITYNAEIETYLTRLTTLTGSAEQANSILEQIKKDALTTPFEVSSLTQAESLLLSTGLSAEQSRNDILALGNAISASGGGNEELSRMAVNLQQIKNVGKASALDIKQFAYAGIDIYGLLADSMGVTREEASQLDVTYDMLSNALQQASSEGGKYYGAMESQSKTYNGAMSNLSESFQVFTGEISQGLFEAVKELIPKLTEMFDWLSANKDTIIAIAVPLLTFINVLTGLFIIKKLVGVVMAFNAALAANPIILIIALIAALVAAFIYAWNNCEAFRNFWIGLWNNIKQVVATWVEGFKIMINGIVNFFGGIINWFKGMFNNWINGWVSIINFIAGVPGAIISFFTSLPGKMLNIGLDIVKGIGKGITGGITWIKNQIKNFVGNVTNFIKKLFKIGSPSKLMANQVGQWLPKGIAVGIDANTDAVYNSMDEMQKGISSTFGLSPQLTNSIGTNYSPNVNVYNNVDVSTDPLGQTVSQIKTFSGGARNDYNYGMGA